MKRLPLLLLALLIGCGQENEIAFDDQAEGLRVNYSDGGPSEPSAETLLALFKTALHCADRFTQGTRAGLPVTPPLVVIVPPGRNDPYDGLTFYESGTIEVERQWIDDRRLWIHEFERWISFSRGVPKAEVDNTPELLICQSLV